MAVRWFAVGQEANGVIALGQFATGVIAIGQIATGVIAIGQVARGVVAVGQLALGVVTFAMVSAAVLWAGGMVGIAARAGLGFVLGLLPQANAQVEDGPSEFDPHAAPQASLSLWKVALLAALAVGWWFAAAMPLYDALTAPGGALNYERPLR